MIRVASFFLYPVKSLRGIPVATAVVDDLGLEGDRRFLVVDPDGRFITQRTAPRMALVSTSLSGGLLRLSAEGAGSVSAGIPSDPSAPTLPVSVWNHEGLLAEDCGEEVASWLSEVLATSCRLVRAGAAFDRPVSRDEARPGDHFSFADGAPLLVTTSSSLDDLNRRIVGTGGAPVPMDRFRPNLVLEGTEPFEEDRWAAIDIARVRFRATGPCDRCIVTTTDQLTGQRGKEPLKTLATFRRDPQDPSSVLFGLNLIQESKSGRLATGDPVAIRTT